MLPPDGDYKEFDVFPRVPGMPRGMERLVVDVKNNLWYYTSDHYHTFKKLDPNRLRRRQAQKPENQPQ